MDAFDEREIRIVSSQVEARGDEAQPVSVRREGIGGGNGEAARHSIPAALEGESRSRKERRERK